MLPLVIGVGNDFAGDDAAGRLVARALADAAEIDVTECHGAAADLVTLMEGRDRVVIVDACVSGAALGHVTRLDGLQDTLPPWLRSVSSHGIGVAEGIALARVLGSLPRRVDIWAIEGSDFCVGAAPCDAVVAASTKVAAALRAELSPA